MVEDVTALRAHLESSRDALALLEGDFSDLRETSIKIERELEDDLRTERKETSRLKGRLVEVASRLQEGQETNRALRSELTSAEEEIARLRDAAVQAAATKVSQEQIMDDLENKCRTALASEAFSRDEVDRLMEENVFLRHEIEDVKEEACRRGREERVELEDLRREVERLNEVDAKNGMKDELIEGLEEEVEILKSLLEEEEVSNHKLNEELMSVQDEMMTSRIGGVTSVDSKAGMTPGGVKGANSGGDNGRPVARERIQANVRKERTEDMRAPISKASPSTSVSSFSPPSSASTETDAVSPWGPRLPKVPDNHPVGVACDPSEVAGGKAGSGGVGRGGGMSDRKGALRGKPGAGSAGGARSKLRKGTVSSIPRLKKPGSSVVSSANGGSRSEVPPPPPPPRSGHASGVAPAAGPMSGGAPSAAGAAAGADGERKTRSQLAYERHRARMDRPRKG